MNKPILKYCGNRSFEDWCLVMDSKADYIGLIFAESRRQVTANEVAKWLELYPVIEGKQLVGVFVNSSLSFIQEIMSVVPLDVIQCHGNETSEFIAEIKNTLGVYVWKAIHHQAQAHEQMKLLNGYVDGYVIDTKADHAWGGTGIAFNWEAVPTYLEEAEKQGVLCLIAGGVNPSNIRKLLHYHPTGIDISSGIEDENQKNRDKIHQIETEVEQVVHNLS